MTDIAEPLVYSYQGVEDAADVKLARIRNLDGNYLTQADVSQITVEVHDKADGSEVIAATALDKTAVVFDTLQVDSVLWPYDSTGYNFKYEAPKSHAPTGGHSYRTVVRINDDTQYPILLVWDNDDVVALAGS